MEIIRLSELDQKKGTSPKKNERLDAAFNQANMARIIIMLKYLASVIVATAAISCGQNEPLSTYEPKSPQEQALKNVFLDFQDGVNTRNADKIENLIHEKASLMIGRERKFLSKAEYRKILPKRLADNPPIALGKPRMKVSDDNAEVKIYITRGDYNGLMIFNMKLEDTRWYIQSWKY